MTYIYVIKKARSVIESCITFEQVETATTYVAILFAKYIREIEGCGGDDHTVYYTAKTKKNELVRWAKMLIKRQKLKVRIQ